MSRYVRTSGMACCELVSTHDGLSSIYVTECAVGESEEMMLNRILIPPDEKGAFTCQT